MARDPVDIGNVRSRLGCVGPLNDNRLARTRQADIRPRLQNDIRPADRTRTQHVPRQRVVLIVCRVPITRTHDARDRAIRYGVGEDV